MDSEPARRLLAELAPLVDRALDLAPAERAAWLAALRLERPALAAELEALLAGERELDASGFLSGLPDALSEAEASLVGCRVGAYTVERPLGQGGMGSVWLARRSDGRYDAVAALKLLNLALVDGVGSARFRHEGSALARLSHPNVARLYDAGVTEAGQPYLVLEYVEGARIDGYCDERRLDPRQRLGLFSQVLAAVAHAHAHRLIHRDLKPSNILVTADGTVKLLDFGIAKLLEDGASTEPSTLTGQAGQPLTPEYAAPEQLAGEPITPATDVYALGVLLYLLLAGRHPADAAGRSPGDRRRAALDADPPRLSAVAGGAEHRGMPLDQLRRFYAGDLDRVVAKALCRRAADRYASVEALAEDLGRVLAGEPIAARPPSFRKRAAWLAPPLALSLILAGALVWPRGEIPTPSSDRVMLAVMPFQNLTGDQGQEYFSDGLTEEMITQLGSLDPAGLGVIARASVMHFKHTQEPPERIGRDLGVQYLVLGSVRRDAGTVRVTAQLLRARDHAQLWAHQYDRQLSGLLTLQGEIAGEISDAIQSSLGTRSPAWSASAARPPPDEAAYDLYLRGQYLLNKRTDADIRAAASYFEQAVQRDSGFARAWAALADADVLGAVYTIRPPQQLVARARAAASRALALDSSLAEAHTALALIVQNHDWDWDMAEREYRRAIALDPNYATAHHWYAEHLMWRGRFDEALRESERARLLDPLSLIIAADHGAILYHARRYDPAIEQLRSVRTIDPTLSRAHILIAAYTADGAFDQALAEEERWRPLVQAPVRWATLAYVYGCAGRTAEARHAIQELIRASRREAVQARVFAWAYAGVQDTAQTLAWLERAYAEHSGEMAALKVSPVYDFLRADPRFQRLLARVGLGT